MSKAEMPTTSFRWDGSGDFDEALEELAEQGELPVGVSRSEAMRAVLNAWADDPDPSVFTRS
jgi:hypothetical protein